MRPELPLGWRWMDLGSLSANVRYGYTASAIEVPVGPKFLRITDIVGGAPNWDHVPHCTIGDGEIDRYRLRAGDIVIARTGASAGVAAHCAPPCDAVFASYLVRFRMDLSRAHPRFIGYVLGSPSWREFVAANATGSAQPQLNAAVMQTFELAVPPLAEQERIATLLGALDDKIDSNRRLAGLLEEAAAILFRARFVDFVGVEEFDDSEIGPIPRGWTVRPVGDVVSVVGGSTPSTKEPRYWDGGTHCWATPKDLSETDSRVLLDTKRHITGEGVRKVSSGMLPRRTVLLSSRAPIGYTALSAVEVAVNQGFIAVPPSGGIPSEFVLCWLHENMERIKNHAGGTTFAEISKRAFRPLPIVVPPAPALAEFEQKVRPMFDLLAEQAMETRTLVGARDALLPRLVSGQIRVPDRANTDEICGPAPEQFAGTTS
jgi:type I restriction enzyme S subunit